MRARPYVSTAAVLRKTEERLRAAQEELASLRAKLADAERDARNLRQLVVDIDLRGVGHQSLCEGGWKGKDCPCGADALQRRINEATT